MIEKNLLKNRIGVHVPSIMLPKQGIDLTKWSVVACDQYTSQLEYWSQVDTTIGECPSTLNLIFPEVYLEKGEDDDRINRINSFMKKYIENNILVEESHGFIFIDRKTSHAPSRKGLILAVDLEQYDYSKGSQSLIRATEGTVLDRLPPRIRIRQDAAIELPHIMLLIDDPDGTVIEPLSSQTHKFRKIYDFDLMMNGGHISGYKVEDAEIIGHILASLERLANPDAFMAKYDVGSDKGVLLFAAGDGNHSLATAKACWENLKKNLSEEEIENHPSRYALVEVVNVHDEGLKFEPIHRVVFNVEPQCLINEMLEYFDGTPLAFYRAFSTKEEMFGEAAELRKSGRTHVIPFISKETLGAVIVNNPKYNLEVGTLQSFLDEYVKRNPEAKIDYIHGDDVVDSLGSRQGNIGFYLPPMDKKDLFKTVILDGVLPRKTFSMGEAEEKRFYLECRKII